MAGVDNGKPFVAPTDNYEMKPNELVEIPTYESERVTVEDEWDTQAICKQIVEQNPVIIKAKYAGSGKSYIGEYMKNLSYNAVCVSNQPTATKHTNRRNNEQ